MTRNGSQLNRRYHCYLCRCDGNCTPSDFGLHLMRHRRDYDLFRAPHRPRLHPVGTGNRPRAVLTLVCVLPMTPVPIFCAPLLRLWFGWSKRAFLLSVVIYFCLYRTFVRSRMFCILKPCSFAVARNNRPQAYFRTIVRVYISCEGYRKRGRGLFICPLNFEKQRSGIKCPNARQSCWKSNPIPQYLPIFGICFLVPHTADVFLYLLPGTQPPLNPS